jgi:hypothetical protein
MPVHGIGGSAFVNGLICVTGGGIRTGGSSGSTMNQVYRPAVGIGSSKADFDGDGHSDIVWQNTATGVRAIWLMNGTTWVGERFLPTVAPEWRIAGTGDFNRDNQSDLILQNLTDGRRAIWLMNGTTRAAEHFLPTVPVDWRIAGTGDGDSDVLWQHGGTGQRAIWLMDQTNWVGERLLPVVPIAWEMSNH